MGVACKKMRVIIHIYIIRKKNCSGGSFFVHQNTEQEAKTNAKFI